jgi:ATP-dependent helicase/nuclease subunit A
MSDDAVRRSVLDPERSFIVQAPAGSGKTELLIQRYLALLATVQGPEQVVAITFTRKAAAEMRRRVLQALRAAAAGATGRSAHERATLELARAVVARDRELDWSVLAQPQRLRVDTLDAFCVWLAHQLPVLAGGIAAARIVDDATDYYREAAQRTLDALAEPGEVGANVRALLRAFDNNVESLETLLAALLPKRDQWLASFAGAHPSGLRARLENALARLVDEELESLADACVPSARDELVPVLRHAAQFAAEPELRAKLAPWQTADLPPRAGRAALDAWQGAAAALLTGKGEWRRRLDKVQGFGPEHAAARARALEAIDELAAHEALHARLASVRKLPDPRYTDPQWERLAALRIVLRRLAAELKVLFAERRTVDFAELGLAARAALGAVDAPSELLLALDRRIQHVLVDEFQDTSQSQLKLLELLTAGWQAGDGRTLFLVGDPMQSIYRFRDADMSLFLRAKQRGIGDVRLESATLERNFRSAPAVVGWVNDVFAGVFPADDDIAAGSAGFRASLATRSGEPDSQLVRAHGLRGADARDETARVLEILESERARDPQQSIAVLVQSRTHLAGLHERLRSKGWPVQAVEIEALAEQPLAQSLLGLARALLHLGDRIAWLAVLKAPWCGLTWTDLHELVADSPDRAVWESLHSPESLARLSADGRRRAELTRNALAAAFARRAARPLAAWVEATWRSLDGPACMNDPADSQTAQQFFELLGRAERRGDLDDPARLDEILARAKPQGEPPRQQGIEIMTMHRAKGLEFDTVVLLGLGRETRGDESQALYWLQRVAADGADDLLIAPLAPERDDDRLVDFVRRAERNRTLAERARLLYVATTRARNRLHLVCQWPADKDRPAANTLLDLLWPWAERELAVTTPPGDAPTEAGSFAPILRRLRIDGAVDPLALEQRAPTLALDERPQFEWAGQAAVHVGTVVHRHLQLLADRGVETWSAAAIRASADAFRAELQLLGVERAELPAATTRVVEALAAAVDDRHGRWVLGKHDDARSELRVTLLAENRLEHLRIDRTFVADGVRWVIDFKTSAHQGGDVEAFLDSEVERYRAQLEGYANALAAIDALPVKVGLYFPLLRALRTWSAQRAPATASP